MAPTPDDTKDAAPPEDWPAAAAAERHFNTVVETSPTALVLAGADGRIEMANRRAERMFGYSREELTARPLETLLAARSRRKHVRWRRDFMTDISSHLMGEVRDSHGLRKDGSEFSLEIRLNSIELDGKPMLLTGIVDTTARQRIEYEKDQQRIELERSNAELEGFAYVASHDLTAPLRAISHLAEWISDDIGSTASAGTISNLNLLRARVTRMQSLLDGLLSYARIRKSHAIVDRVDINQVVGDVVTALSPPPGFSVVCDGSLPSLRTHRAPIQAVLQNLISNSIKHHDRDEGRIVVAMKLENGVAEFRVSDDGPGVEPRFQQQIFVIFQTLASRDDVESNGIGLAIVKQRVEAHGGRVRIESAPPLRGTTIVFTWKEPTA